MISIELISKGESKLGETLESIRSQDFSDLEIICADSSNNKKTEETIKEFDCVFIRLPERTRALKARYEAHIHSNGEWCFLLDSTRPLKKHALNTLMKNYLDYDMTIVLENGLGKGFWVEQAKKLTELSIAQAIRLPTETLAFLLPRFYKRSVLNYSFSNILAKTGNVFEKISYGEHHLIFEEALNISKNVGLTDESLISHFEDDSLIKILKKYHWYGKSQRELKLLERTETQILSRHLRKDVPLRKRIGTLPIATARIIPFLFGYYII